MKMCFYILYCLLCYFIIIIIVVSNAVALHNHQGAFQPNTEIR